MTEAFTKDEYIAWLASRGPEGTWDLADCRRADAHILDVTIDNAQRWANAFIHCAAREWFMSMVVHHYGSAETDELLMKINAYPKYMA